MAIVITDFHRIAPRMCISQQDFRRNLYKAILRQKGAQGNSVDSREIETFVDKYTVDPQQIKQRFFEFSSFYTHFPENGDSDPEDISEALMDRRMQSFDKTTSELFKRFYDVGDTPPDDIIHVTCCGYNSPSPAQRLVGDHKWPSIVTHSYHMGCAGAFPAVRTAAGYMSARDLYEQKERVDIVHTELLSIHATSIDVEFDAEALVLRSLFGDGIIKYSLLPEEHLSGRKGLKILAFREKIFPQTLADMSWKLFPEKFKMTLSSRVPLIMGTNILAFCREIFGQLGIDFDDIRSQMILALHPGGPKIVDFIQKYLKLADHQVRYSRDVLYEYGNMSSATVPHIWQMIAADDGVAAGTKILSIGFGPGLAAHGMIAEKV